MVERDWNAWEERRKDPENHCWKCYHRWDLHVAKAWAPESFSCMKETGAPALEGTTPICGCNLEKGSKEAFDNYRDLLNELLIVRHASKGKETDQESEILDAMDAAWHEMAQWQKDHFDTPPPIMTVFKVAGYDADPHLCEGWYSIVVCADSIAEGEKQARELMDKMKAEDEEFARYEFHDSGVARKFFNAPGIWRGAVKHVEWVDDKKYRGPASDYDGRFV